MKKKERATSDKKEIKIGVKDLLEMLYHPKDLGVLSASSTRGQEGGLGHRLIRDRRPPHYQTEVPVEFTYTTDDYQLMVRGRIDGILECDEDNLEVEEIKTTYMDVDRLQAGQYPIHEAQLRLYIYFLQAQKKGREIHGKLTYVNLNDLTERSFPVEAAPKDGERFFQEMADAFLNALRERDRWRAVRNESLEKLAFPFSQSRPGQDELMETVHLALEQELDLFLEAATGIGKTVGVLYPSLKRLAETDRFSQIFFLTAKTEGKQILKKTLQIARENGLKLRTIFIEAKERVCLYPGTDCKPEACPCAVDYYTRVEEVIPELLREELILPEKVLECAKQNQLCPFELSLDLSLQTDLIVGDYNYLFDPGVYLKRFFLSGRKDYLFLIDEAHNLVQRGREMYSATLDQKVLAEIRKGIGDLAPVVVQEIDAVQEFFEAWAKEMEVEEKPGLRLGRLPEMLEPVLERLSAVLERFLSRFPVGGTFHRYVQEFYFELGHFLRIMAYIGKDYTIYVKKSEDYLVLRLFCMNPGPMLRKRLDGGRSAVFFSATLSPQEYFRELLGGKSDALSLQLTSPFPQETRLYMHIPGVDTRYKARESSAFALAEIAYDMVTAHTGNYFMFFPSYAYLNTVRPLIVERLNGVADIHVQYPAMKEEQKRRFLQKVTSIGLGRSNLGLAVLGGIFGEGVDLPGEQLVGVCNIGLGLPMINEEQELIREYFEEKNGNGYLYAYYIPGLIRVIQSAGRVFRTPEDKGVVLLVDERFADERIQEMLPPDWFRTGRAFSQADYREALAEFWGGML
ncbi:MAG TPA: helicase C-terminal domain-containing protein [Bacillota bacterium]|nr:helicase C-terminal domain-containing protein [Bacillota bacterium]